MNDLQDMDIIMENTQEIAQEMPEVTEVMPETQETTQEMTPEQKEQLANFKAGAMHRTNIYYGHYLNLLRAAGEAMPEDLMNALQEPYANYGENGFHPIGRAKLLGIIEFTTNMEEIAGVVNPVMLALYAREVVLENLAVFPQHRMEIESSTNRMLLTASGISSSPQSAGLMNSVIAGKFFMEILAILLRSRSHEAVVRTYEYRYTWRDDNLRQQFLDSLNTVAAILAEYLLPILSEADMMEAQAKEKTEAEAAVAEQPTEKPAQPQRKKRTRKPAKKEKAAKPAKVAEKPAKEKAKK